MDLDFLCFPEKSSVKKRLYSFAAISVCALCIAVCCCSAWQSLVIILGRGQRLVSVMCEH